MSVSPETYPSDLGVIPHLYERLGLEKLPKAESYEKDKNPCNSYY